MQLPRTDVTAKTTFTYIGGVLTNVQDALGHNTNVATYKPGGWPLTVRDQNHTLTTLRLQPAPVADLERAGEQFRQPHHQPAL